MLQTIIDYLKFDVDNSEWSAIEAMYQENSLKNVKQIGLEIHFFHSDRNKDKQVWIKYFNTIKLIEKMGFLKWRTDENVFVYIKSPISGIQRTLCYEMVYVNSRFIA